MTLYDKIRFRYGLYWGVRKTVRKPIAYVTLLRFAVCVLAILLLYLKSSSASAIAEAEVAAELAKSAANSAEASLAPALGIIKQCVSRGENPIYIGDELWFVGAVPSGIKK